MSDFIFSTKQIKQRKITKKIQSIYHEDKPHVREFRGNWGSLGISSNLYHGFNPYENEQFIAVIVGGPLLMFRDNSFLNEKDSFEGTKAIYKRWQAGEMIWDSDLNGPFVVLIINKQTEEALCVTDLMSFIPVYEYKNSNYTILSTHVDALARITGESNNLDEVSIADFILHGVVTYPYTSYSNIFQIAPASKHNLLRDSIKLKSTSYWIPFEKNGFASINEAANDLRISLQDYTNKITNETENIAQFISGGEDSRTLSALLKDNPRDAYIFLDHMNREGSIAEKVADKYGANFKLAARSKLHYLNILPNCSELVGSGSQYQHAHTYGFHKTCNLNRYDAVFGGLFSDALLKGSRVRKISGSGLIPLVPALKNYNYSAAIPVKNTLFTSVVLLKLTKRRQAHLKYVKEFRNVSAEEWFELWPSSMNMHTPNIHVNRRLFRSYEPFMSMEVIKISAVVPQKWKLNRRLFHRAVKPYLKPSKWLAHGSGWLPYFPWYLNTFLYLPTWVYRQLAKRLGLIKGNQGPWGEWSVLINSAEWEQALANHSEGVDKNLNIFTKKISRDLLISSELTIPQFANLTQILYLTNSEK